MKANLFEIDVDIIRAFKRGPFWRKEAQYLGTRPAHLTSPQLNAPAIEWGIRHDDGGHPESPHLLRGCIKKIEMPT
jgi:hypothetical protein